MRVITLRVKVILILAVVIALARVSITTYVGYRVAMHHIGYRGRGSVDKVADLPYGYGEVFRGLEAQGKVQYAYKTGPRGARCLFTGSASEDHVANFCREQRGRDGLSLGNGDWTRLVRDLKAEPSVFLGNDSGDVLYASWDTKYGTLSIIYRRKDKRFVAYGIVDWAGLRRRRWRD